MAGTDTGVPLADMIETLRQELQSSLQRGAGQDVAFDIEKVELELKVVVTRKEKGQIELGFWVLTAGGGAERGRDASHTFKLTLLPIMSTSGRRLKVETTVSGKVSDD